MDCWCIRRVPAKSVAELIALAKEKPGGLTYGTAGVGTALHTAALLLESLAGIKLTAVHYRGAAPALNDLIAGHINMITMGPSVALPAVKAGKINMLGFGSQKRVAQFPDVPTIAETVPGYDAERVVRPVRACGHAAGCVVKINADVQQIIGDPEFHKKFLEPHGGAAGTRLAGSIRRVSAKGFRQMGQGHPAPQA